MEYIQIQNKISEFLFWFNTLLMLSASLICISLTQVTEDLRDPTLGYTARLLGMAPH